MSTHDYDRRRKSAGEGDLEKTVPEAIKWIDRLVEHAQKAKHELTTKKEPGSATSAFVGYMKGYMHESWHDHFFR